MFDINNIKDPSFLKDLSIKELEQLSNEIREFIIQSVSKTGGHLSSNLGVVELTVALHYVFNSPVDKFIFDVGHQSYIHKILTGRANQFDTLRKHEGLSGFIKRKESIHDVYEAGHSSTSIAALSGFEYSKDTNSKNIAIIGDGALTGGMAFEALNFLGGELKHAPIIVLNDNEMSISENIGFLNRTLNNLRQKRFIIGTRRRIYKILPRLLKRLGYAVEKGIKSFLHKNTFFDDLGFTYYGPINGHNIEELIKYLNYAKKANKPCVIHVLTEKGKGYKYAEEDEYGFWHGVSKFDVETGEKIKKSKKNLTSYSTIVSEYMVKKASSDKDFKVIIPAMIPGSSLNKFQELYPDQIIDVGIAEQMAVTMASGVAVNNKDVFVPIYSTFIQRAYDQVNHDVARQNLKVVFGIDRSGIVGADGETHQGLFDIPLLNHIPNMTVVHGRNALETHKLLNYGFKVNKGPFAVRYERTTKEFDGTVTDEVGTLDWEILREGSKVCLLLFGDSIERLLPKLNDLDVMVIDAKCIKPLDRNMLDKIKNYPIITYEESILNGGFGSSVIDYYNDQNITVNIKRLGINDQYVLQGSRSVLLKELKLDIDSIIKVIKEYQ